MSELANFDSGGLGSPTYASFQSDFSDVAAYLDGNTNFDSSIHRSFDGDLSTNFHIFDYGFLNAFDPNVYDDFVVNDFASGQCSSSCDVNGTFTIDINDDSVEVLELDASGNIISPDVAPNPPESPSGHPSARPSVYVNATQGFPTNVDAGFSNNPRDQVSSPFHDGPSETLQLELSEKPEEHVGSALHSSIPAVDLTGSIPAALFTKSHDNIDADLPFNFTDDFSGVVDDNLFASASRKVNCKTQINASGPRFSSGIPKGHLSGYLDSNTSDNTRDEDRKSILHIEFVDPVLVGKSRDDPEGARLELSQRGHAFLNGLFIHLLETRQLQKHYLPSTKPELPYVPNISMPAELVRDPNGPNAIYKEYFPFFATSAAAKAYRKHSRLSPKKATDLERVKTPQAREFWVQQIYEAMIDISAIDDGEHSIHRQRFAEHALKGFSEQDLVATAHHILDKSIGVHERGWNRPTAYHKKVVRGKLTDISHDSIEKRLWRICVVLKKNKAIVDDAIRGGVTLSLLCDNPEARGFTKASNNTGNKKRGQRLKNAPRDITASAVEDED